MPIIVNNRPATVKRSMVGQVIDTAILDIVDPVADIVIQVVDTIMSCCQPKVGRMKNQPSAI